MKLNLYLLTILTFLSVQAFSQDKIYKKNGEVVEAKIIEVLEGEIKYKIFNDQDGPLYTVDKDRLTKIIYQTGREETFTGSLRDAALYADQSRKAIKLNFLSPLAGYTQLSYEQNVKPGRSYELTLGIIGLGKRQKVDSYSNGESPPIFIVTLEAHFLEPVISLSDFLTLLEMGINTVIFYRDFMLSLN
jgi:hypothetical protein